MCKLKYIIRQDNAVLSDQEIIINHRDFDLLHRPYYLLKNLDIGLIKFSFHYLDFSEERLVLSNDFFSIKYGSITGRLYSLTIITRAEVENKIWDIFKEYLKVNARLETFAHKRLLITFTIIKKIYFNNYKEL